MSAQENFDALTSQMQRQIMLLRQDLSQLLKMGPNDLYRAPLRQADTELATLQVALEAMRYSPAPLYFIGKSNSKLRPTVGVSLPDSLIELLEVPYGENAE